MRENPFMWDDEAPQGVLSPFEESVDGGAEALTLLGLPTGNAATKEKAVRADAVTSAPVRALLAAISAALRAAASEGKAWRRRVDHLSSDDRAILFDALGEGEVSVVISAGSGDEGEVQVHETVLPGVWIGRAADAAGAIQAHWVEVADAPRAFREAAEVRPRGDIALEALSPPRGAMNVMGVLAEIRERAQAWRPGVANHVINFTLFPMTEADSAFLARVLGEAGVRAASGGYGAARVIMTGLKRVWAVQYLNGMGTVILDTIEVGDAPSAMLASREDFEDSAARLLRIEEAYQEDTGHADRGDA